MNKYIKFLFLVGVLGIAACVKPPEFPIEPVIDFMSVSKTTVRQSSDSLVFVLNFTDGDGDIGLSDTDTIKNVFVTDNRLGVITDSYKIPPIPRQGISNGISGEITFIILPQICCNTGITSCFPTLDTHPEDEVEYSVYIVDKAGNVSNTLTLPKVTIICD